MMHRIVLYASLFTLLGSAGQDAFSQSAPAKPVPMPQHNNRQKESDGKTASPSDKTGQVSPGRREKRMNTKNLVEKANLVFHGQVKSVEYGKSLPDERMGTFPITYITYQIVEVLHGQYAGSEITLQQIGGPGEDSSILSVEGSPIFNVADEDILFVSNNGKAISPVVEEGRFRILDSEDIYDETGNTVLDSTGDSDELASDDRIRTKDKRILVRKIGDAVVEYVSSEDPVVAEDSPNPTNRLLKSKLKNRIKFHSGKAPKPGTRESSINSRLDGLVRAQFKPNEK